MPYTQARVDAALDAANGTGGSAVAWAILHDGDPGVDGTTNQLSQSSATAASFPAAASGESEDIITFNITGATSPITDVSLWTDSAGSPDVFVGSGALTPEESFGGAGDLEVTITTSASST